MEFYSLMMEQCKTANKRLVWSALYLGNGVMEKNLIDELRKNSLKNSDLKVSIIFKKYIIKIKIKMQFDQNRSTRDARSMFKERVNTPTMLTPLFYNNPNKDNVTLGFFSPYDKQGVLDYLIPKSGIRETKGTYHTKFMICDNQVLMTGANLSEEYFVSRKDRYVLINDCPELADYLEDFMNCFYESGEHFKLLNDFPDFSGKKKPDNTQLKNFYEITSKDKDFK